MADTKISALPSATTLGGTELLAGVQSGGNVSITPAQIATYVLGGGAIAIASGKTLTVSNTLTFTGTDSSSVAFGTGGTVLYNGGALGTPSSGTLTNATGLPAAGVVGTAAVLGANTFTATQTITPAVNTNALAVTGYSLTGTNTSALLDLAGTWNTSGVASGLKLNIVNTASATGSKLLDFQINGSSKFYASIGGTSQAVYSTIGLIVGGGLASGNAGLTTFGFSSDWNVSGNAQVSSGGMFGWTTSSTDARTSTVDLSLFRDSPNTLAQRNSTNSQKLRVYGSFTDSSDGDWLESSKSAGGAAYIRTVANGTGTASTLSLGTGGTNYWTIDTSGNWTSASTGILAPVLNSSKTGNFSVTTTLSGTHFDNIGASGEVDFALPAAAVGLTYTFTVKASQVLKVIATASTTISIGASTSASAGNISSSGPYASVTIYAISTTEWVAKSSTGTWTVT